MNTKTPHGAHIAPNVRNWASQIDANTVKQAATVGRLPILAGNVALMPDAHLGYGATVGSVIATDGAILPSAVGVDIGCFSGDTKVPLLNSQQIDLKSLAETGESVWVYAYDHESSSVVPAQATCRMTRRNAEMILVTIAGGETVRCTPDHQFMLLDGSYREARNLRVNDSLMPLYRRWQARDGYESVSTGRGKARLTHRLVFEHSHGAIPDGHVVHHKDHSHFNNEPNNLELMTVEEHSAHRRITGHQFTNADPEFQRRHLEGVLARKNDPQKRTLMKEVGTRNLLNYMATRNEHFKSAVQKNGERGRRYLVGYNTTSRPCLECNIDFPNPTALRWHRHYEHAETFSSNHKVLSLARLNERSDVYCLIVPGYNNFALAAGVFVHNCGMTAALTDLTRDHFSDGLEGLLKKIADTVPAGVGQGHQDITGYAENWFLHNPAPNTFETTQRQKARAQFGSLGSGNHFLELSTDESGRVWLVLHSGSRGIGNQIARQHIATAKQDFKNVVTGDYDLEDKDLAWFVQHTPQFDAYIRDLRWCQKYAFGNREAMFRAALVEVFTHVGHGKILDVVACHHNYAELESYDIDGVVKDVWVTRKGAVRARQGDRGIIPGSMGTDTYIVKGLGNLLSWNSCSHGAGRRMSRTKAKKTITPEQLSAQMGERIWLRDESARLVDEAPDAYKNIEDVMEDQSDLVRPIHRLESFLNYKG